MKGNIDLPSKVVSDFGVGGEEQSSVCAWPCSHVPRCLSWTSHDSITSSGEEVHIPDDVCRRLWEQSRPTETCGTWNMSAPGA